MLRRPSATLATAREMDESELAACDAASMGSVSV